MAAQDLDLSFLYEIADGSNEFIVDSIDMFMQQAPELLNTIGNSINNGEWPAAGAAAHKLKPNLGFFGMLESQANMQDIELLCKAGGQDPDDIKMKFLKLKEVVDANLVRLAQIKAEKAALL